MTSAKKTTDATVDPEEVARFSRIAAEWWDPTGKFRPLHVLNPIRLAYVKELAAAHFGRDGNATDALSGLRLVDIGCGGGLISEPMARLGAAVTGVDPSATNIEVARLHAGEAGLAIDYRATTAETLAEAGETYDIVLALEVVEHVADLGLFVKTCGALAKPGGLVVFATLNRTLKAFALAIVGAEYVLGWLPKGTHQWSKFVTPRELEDFAGAAGLDLHDDTGIVYNPLTDRWSKSRDMDVNY
ncbi:MAG: bifunctional 2-polyprenyl-6-hydroxyphenol methylase/3-demethylubiquinol 3-O-methyltransferase UbiG, partial [Hyphomicrobiales bacterium]|nr:bifunctional 2-polyprenyl-6-hydroxyphenol methylase/3-demethylubiquinol 3-O-methyltransferase UbiG [Hyphomicrobiales bacterium]